MYYQLLGETIEGTPARYRGVRRSGPIHQDHLPEDAPANRAWEEYLTVHYQKIGTKEDAVRLAEQLRRDGLEFDIVRVQNCDAPPEDSPPGLLGYDIVQYEHHSLLAWGHLWHSPPVLPASSTATIMRLMHAYFAPKLNEVGLFGEWQDARFFLDVVHAVAELAPGTWESPGHERFEILQLVDCSPGH